MNVRASTFRTTLLPAVLYARETWSITKSDEEKFAMTESNGNKDMWRSLGLSKRNCGTDWNKGHGIRNLCSKIKVGRRYCTKICA